MCFRGGHGRISSGSPASQSKSFSTVGPMGILVLLSSLCHSIIHHTYVYAPTFPMYRLLWSNVGAYADLISAYYLTFASVQAVVQYMRHKPRIGGLSIPPWWAHCWPAAVATNLIGKLPTCASVEIQLIGLPQALQLRS